MCSTITSITNNRTKPASAQTCRNFFAPRKDRSISTRLCVLLVALLLGSILPAGVNAAGCPAPSFAPVVTYASGGSSVYSVATGDFNGDGKPDLVATNFNSNSVGVRLNNGNGTFGPVKTYPSGGNKPYAVAVGDFNGDGKGDLAVTTYNSNTVAVLMNNGSGSFLAAVTYASGGDSPGSVVAADFNGDGKADLAVTNYYSANVGVLLNKGNGIFNPVVTYGSGGFNPNSVAAGNFNGDNKPDLVVANYSSGKVGVLVNNGSGAFAPVVPYNSGNPDPIAVTTGDFNGDGKADIAAAHFNSSTVGVLLNNGSGVFGAAALYGSGGTGPYSVAAADFNGDGKADLVAANYSTNSAGVLLNTGSGAFAAAVAFSSGGNNAYAVAAADFNADGKPDLAVANHITNTIGILLNTCKSCPVIAVSIPDAEALAYGVEPNTVYPGYAPATSITLKANVSGGTGPYYYTWSTGSHSSSIAVSPATKAAYTVTVTDANNCPGNKASKTVYVINVRGGRKGNKVLICHNPGRHGETRAVKEEKVEEHLKHGDALGSCSRDGSCTEEEDAVILSAQAVDNGVPAENKAAQISVKALPNPSSQYFVLNIQGGDGAQKIYLRVMDLSGRLVEQKNNLVGNQTLRIGAFYSPGIYFAEILQGKQKTVVKLVKR